MSNRNNPQDYHERDNREEQEELEEEGTPMEAEDVSQYYPTDETYNGNGDEDVFYDYEEEKEKPKKQRQKGRGIHFSTTQIVVLAILFVVYTAVIFTAAWLIFYRPAQPSPDQVPFDTTLPEEESGGNEKPPLDNLENFGESETTESSSSVVVGNEYAAKEGVYNILVVGRDSAASLADVTMLVNLDTNTNKMAVMQIPRDTLINLDVPTNKVNAAYSTFLSSAYQNGEDNPTESALERYAAMYEQNLCINIHHVVMINLEGFINIVNLFGGVEIYVQEPMYYNDPEQNLYINIGSGYQTLDGYNAMCFVRYRSGYVQADLGRVNAQKIFLTAFFQKVKNSISITNLSLINDVVSEIFQNVTTDMGTADLIYFAKALLGVNLDAIDMMTLPGNGASVYYVMNRAATLEAINQYFNIYQTDISDTIFDRNRVFCMESVSSIYKTYYGDADSVLDGVHNAEDIDSESIYIPHLDN